MTRQDWYRQHENGAIELVTKDAPSYQVTEGDTGCFLINTPSLNDMIDKIMISRSWDDAEEVCKVAVMLQKGSMASQPEDKWKDEMVGRNKILLVFLEDYMPTELLESPAFTQWKKHLNKWEDSYDQPE